MSHHRKPLKPLPPVDKVYLHSNGLKEDGDATRLLRTICKQPFIFQLDVQIPVTAQNTQGSPSLPVELLDTLLVDYTFQHARLDPSKLLSSSFMNSYVRTGTLIALSCTTNDGDVLALDGTGRLCLSLQKDTYERLGLMGNPSRYSKGRLRFFVTIDLRFPYMRDGKPGYEKLKQNLAKLGEIDMMFTFMNEFGFPSAVTFPEAVASRTYKLRLDAHPSASLSIRHAQLLRKLLERQQNHKRKAGNAEDANAKLQATVFSAVNDRDDTQLSGESISLHGFIHPALIRSVFESLNRQKKPFAMTAHVVPASPVQRSYIRGSNTKKRPPTNDERNIESDTLDGWLLVVFPPVPREQSEDEAMREQEQVDTTPQFEYILYETR